MKLKQCSFCCEFDEVGVKRAFAAASNIKQHHSSGDVKGVVIRTQF
jgi:hypothetical protein